MKRLIAIASVALVSEMLSPGMGRRHPARPRDRGDKPAGQCGNAPGAAPARGKWRLKAPALLAGSDAQHWVLADYTCETLCGPMISIVSDALAQSGLRPGVDFRLVAVGLDPKDTAADAASMKQAQVGASSEIAAAVYFLRGDGMAIAALTTALGFRSAYDRDRDQYAHPAAAFVVAPDGRIARVLPGLSVEPASIRLALVDAGKGTVGTFTDHIRLLCYGYDPASGTYTVAIGRLLATSGGATIAALVLLITLLLRRERLKGGKQTSVVGKRTLVSPPQTDGDESQCSGQHQADGHRREVLDTRQDQDARLPAPPHQCQAAQRQQPASRASDTRVQQSEEGEYELSKSDHSQHELPAIGRPPDVPDCLVRNVAGPDHDVLHGMKVGPQQDDREQKRAVALGRADPATGC